MSAALFACIAGASLAWVQAAAAPPPTMEEIAAAVARLGDDSFEVRQRATEWLWRAGEVVEPQLRAALKSTDPEIRTRAASVLDKVRYGLRPDTPPEIAALIDQFRHGGSLPARRQALAGLQAKGQWSIVLTLLRGESDPQQRRQLAEAISADAGKLLRPLLEQGDFDQAEQVLELTALNETGLAQLAAFLLLTERLEPRIDALRQKLTLDPQEDDWRRLAIYLRAKGDFSAAADAAAKTSDIVFSSKVMAEAGRFAEAAKLADELAKANKMPDAAAYAAAYFQLAGDEPQFQRLLETLKAAANIDKLGAPPAVPADPFGVPSNSPQLAHAWRLAETLLIVEQIEPALAVLKKTHPLAAHALLVRQHRHREALDYCGVKAGQALDRKWFDALPGGLGDPTQQLSIRFSLAAQIARQLRELGLKEPLQEVLESLRQVAAIDGQRGMRWASLAALEFQLDRYDESFADAEQALASNQAAASVFTGLVKKQGSLAAAWFGELTNRDPLADRKAAIAQAVWLVSAQPPAGKVPANWRELIQKSADEARKLSPPERGARLMLPADICRLRGDLPLARKLYEEAEEGYAAATLRAGDVAAAQGDWPAAVAKYAKLAELDANDPLAIYLHGHALTKSGQAEAGAKKLRLASLTALAPDVRYGLALGLQERDLTREAAEQFELARRSALPDSSHSVWSAQQVGNLVNGAEPQRAADCWRQLHLHILSSSSNFIESEGYLSLPQIIHKVRARALLVAGQAAAMQAELDQCEKLLPGDVRLIVDLTPKLEAAGQKAVADKLFERGIAAHQRVLEEFPESQTFLNNAAWICARAQRQLDEALALAQRALKLAPNEASYHDTLAEIQFQRADREAAVAAARRAVELSPDSKLFAARLAHFQNDPVKTLDASND